MFSFILGILKFKRLVQIGIILMRYATREFSDHVIFYHYRKRRTKTTKQVYTTPQRIRETIEELGPTYVKFGQILADRPDVVSDKFRVELKKLQSKANPFDTNVAISIIEKSLGHSINEIFKTFDDTPLAAASIGQVYRATLHTGKEVIIKVQRPLIENKIKLDIYLMKFLSHKLATKYPELAAINIVGLIDEFSQDLTRELDYTNETANMNIFIDMFADSETIVIPRVYDQFTSKYTIVMDYIEGVTPDDREKLIDSGFDTEKIVANGTDAIFKMTLQYGIFHADPHPGNLFILSNNRIAFIDFGMVGMLRPKDMNFLADFIVGYARKDSTTICKSLLTLCDLKYFDKIDELNFAIQQMLMRNYGNKMVELKNFADVMRSSIDILIKFKLQIPTGIFMLIKTVATLEKFAENMAPDMDLSPYVLPYAKEVIKQRYSARRRISDIKKALEDYTNLIRTLPNTLNEILVKLKEGKIKHDIKLEDNSMFVRAAERFSLRIAYVILVIGLFIGSTILIVWDSEQRFGYFILYLSSIMTLLLLLKWIFSNK